MNKGLQKLTKTEEKFKQLLERDKITKEDVNGALNEAEYIEFGKYLTKLVNEKAGNDLADFIEKISEILTPSTKNQLWENNHYKITFGISKLIEEYGKMPTKNQIADETGLSRQTISKHLKEYQTHPLFAEERLKFKFMTDRVLAKVYKLAVTNEDIKAARLYFEVTGILEKQSEQNNSINTQNNYIQINQVKITQDNIKQLSQEQINLIEDIFIKDMPGKNSLVLGSK